MTRYCTNERIRIALLLVTLFSFVTGAGADDAPIQQDSLDSHVLNEKRAFQVLLPAAYKPGSAQKYDVLEACLIGIEKEYPESDPNE